MNANWSGLSAAVGMFLMFLAPVFGPAQEGWIFAVGGLATLLGVFALVVPQLLQKHSRSAHEAGAMVGRLAQPGEELLEASLLMRRYGFKIIYALNDDKVEERANELIHSLCHGRQKNGTARRLLENVKFVRDKNLLS